MFGELEQGIDIAVGVASDPGDTDSKRAPRYVEWAEFLEEQAKRLRQCAIAEADKLER